MCHADEIDHAEIEAQRKQLEEENRAELIAETIQFWNRFVNREQGERIDADALAHYVAKGEKLIAEDIDYWHNASMWRLWDICFGR